MQSGPASLPVVDGKYQLVRKLGEGGMGAVYEARHLGTGRRVAVKVIGGESRERSPEAVSRFRREAMASGAIESQYIAQVLDTGVDPASGSPYTVMEMLVGEDLEQAIQRLGPLPPDLAVRIAAQACLGLKKAHEAGVVHRDIKPANLFLAKREEGDIAVKLLDFGIAKVRPDQLSSSESSGLTKTGSMLGSPLYMSPEQARGRKDIDHRTDIWSLGVVLYEALTGVTPHGHLESLGELIFQICSVPARPIAELAPWVSPGIATVVGRTLSVDPAGRFSSIAELYAALRSELPHGHALTEDLFVALPEALRRASSPAIVGASATMTGVANTHGASRTAGVARPGLPILVPTALTLAAVLGIIGWKVVSSRSPSQDMATTVVGSLPPVTPPPSPVPVASAVSPALAAPTVVPTASSPTAASAAPSAVPSAVPVVSAAPSSPLRTPVKRVAASAPAVRAGSGLHMDMK